MKTLVVYYSRAGKVKMAAAALAKELNADICEIIDKDKRKGVFGFIRSGKGGRKKELADIEPLKSDLNEYELIVLCSQIWAGDISCPTRAFLTTYKNDIKDISYLILHMANKEYQEVFDEMDVLVGKKRKWQISAVGKGDFENIIREAARKLI